MEILAVEISHNSFPIFGIFARLLVSYIKTFLLLTRKRENEPQNQIQQQSRATKKYHA